jgi:transcriptional regulator with XRE-family HTH domain
VADALNMEFVRLLANSGWNQSEAAEKLRLSPAVITKYVQGETRPSLTVLKLFKLLIGDLTPLPGDIEATGLETRDVGRPLEAWESDLLEFEVDGNREAETCDGRDKVLLAEIPKREVDYRKKRAERRLSPWK